MTAQPPPAGRDGSDGPLNTRTAFCCSWTDRGTMLTKPGWLLGCAHTGLSIGSNGQGCQIPAVPGIADI